MLWDNYNLMEKNTGENGGSGFQKVDFSDPHLMEELANKSDSKQNSNNSSSKEVKPNSSITKDSKDYENKPSEIYTKIKSESEELDELAGSLEKNKSGLDELAHTHYEKTLDEQNKILTETNNALSDNCTKLLNAYDSLANKFFVKYIKPVIVTTAAAAIAGTIYISSLFNDSNIDDLVAQRDSLEASNAKLTNKVTNDSIKYNNLKLMLANAESNYATIKLDKQAVEKKYAKLDSAWNHKIANEEYEREQQAIWKANQASKDSANQKISTRLRGRR